MALLYDFAIELHNESTAEGYAIIYRGKNTLPNTSHSQGVRIKHDLVQLHGISPDKIKTINGGIKENTSVELWIVPLGAKLPSSLQKESGEIEVTNSLLFDVHGFYLDGDNCAYTIDCPSGKYHFARLDYFAQQLKLNPNLKGYLIAYAQYCPDCGSYGKYSPRGKLIREEKISYRDKSETGAMILKSEKDYLAKNHNIKPSRIITVNGGYREYRNIELWLVPENGEKPKPKPTTFPPKRSKTAKKKARSK